MCQYAPIRDRNVNPKVTYIIGEKNKPELILVG